ncbi:MAG TPA: amino acid ABC transporter substrate-binding protein [Azospirillaceae bacterium]|nr:amino acid ABC transporter substrate-binding protein [Azospirillaceae bacterium]
MVQRLVLWLVALCFLALPGMARPGAAGEVLDRIRREGLVTCGITSGSIGFERLDANGRWTGFYPDMCRVLAAAIIGGADNARFLELSSRNRFEAVRTGEVDVLTSGTTWTLERDGHLGLAFPTVYLYDGQGFMVHKSLGLNRLADLKAGRVCVAEDTTTIRNLEAFIRLKNLPLTLVRSRSSEGSVTGFFNHHCDTITNDRVGLVSMRMTRAPNPADYVIFPDLISKEPLAPVVRQDDPEFVQIVHWAIAATILAEEKGVTSANAGSMRSSDDPEIARLLGSVPGFGAWLGLDDGWAYRIISQVGNYGEIFERNLGDGSTLKMERGINALWTRGGLMYAPPLGG